MDAAVIRILVEANSAAVAAGLAPARLAISSFTRDAESSFGRLRNAFAGLSTGQKVFGGVATAVTLAVTAFSAAIGPAIRFESAFAGVQKTVSGTPAQLSAIRDGLLQLSTVIPVSADQLAGIAESAGQLGVAAPDVLEFTEVVAKLGETTDLDFESAAQSLARFLNVTGDGAGAINEVADVLVALGNNSATTESQIVSMATRLASSFSLAGATSDQIISLAAAFSSLGLQAEAGGTALSRIIIDISDAAIGGNDNLETYARTAGLLPEQFAAIAQENPVEALLLVGEGLRQVALEGGSLTPILEELDLAGIRTGEAFRLLALNVESIRGSVELGSAALAEGAALNEEYGRRAETTASRIALLSNRLNTLAIAVGTPALDTLAVAADLVGDAVLRLATILAPLGSDIANVFGQASSAAQAFFGVVGGPSAAAAVTTLELLVSGLGTVLGAITALGPAGLIISALAADIALVGPVSIAAAKALNAIALAGGGTAGAMIAASRGLNTLLLSINPVAAAAGVLAAAFVFLQLESRKITEEAQATARAFQVDLNTALANTDVAAFSAGIVQVREDLEQAQLALSNTEPLARFNQKVSELTFGLLGGSEEVQALQAEIEALEGVLSADEVENYTNHMERLTEQFGLSESEIIAAAQAQGVLQSLFGGSLTDIEAVNLAVDAYRLNLQDLQGVSEEVAQRIASDQGTWQDWAEVLGLTSSEMVFLTQQIENLDLDDFADPEAAERAALEVANLADAYTQAAEAIGLGREEMIEQLKAVDNLAAAHNRLREAVEGANSALDNLAAQQRIATETQNAFNEALANVTDVESLEAAASALRTYTLNSVAAGEAAVTANQRQLEFAQALIAVGREAGIADEVIRQVITDLGLVPESTLAELEVVADAALATIDDVNGQLEGLTNQAFAADLTVIDGYSLAISEALASVTEWDNTTAAATLTTTDAWSASLNEALAAVAGWVKEYPATLTAVDEASSTIGGVTEFANDFAFGEYIAALQAADAGATDLTAFVRSDARDYADAAYVAALQASDVGASAEIADKQSKADTYDRVYDAGLLATDRGAAKAIAIAQFLASAYDRTYTAILSAIDRASSTIQRAINLLAGFRSKTIYVTTIYRSVGSSASGSVSSSSSSWPSGVFADGGFWSFANGGSAPPRGGRGRGPRGSETVIVDPPRAAPELGAASRWFDAIRATPGRAAIFRAATPGRFFAEPETGGEAYIPLALSKRKRSVAIWMETGRLLGMLNEGGVMLSARSFQNGGILDPLPRTPSVREGVIIQAPIQIDITTQPGQDNAAIASEVRTVVRRELTRAGRDLLDIR